MSPIKSATWVMEGRFSGCGATQAKATCSIATSSSSMFLYLSSSWSKTSAVHSSRTTDLTHLGKSKASSSLGYWDGARPVRTSRSMTPKL
uniref:Uncharacterized protein n=1 Tax=Kalanchoe fedtschenkoi TaxID=63787 RepID=A0A7N0ZQR1_KALFE